jgi:hypothetical protein
MTQMGSSLGGGKQTGRPPSSLGQPTNRSDLDTSQRGKRSLKSQSSSNTLESGRRLSSVSAASEIFHVGDNVDALCVVQNGNQRWFPGVILSRAPHTPLPIQSLSLDENEPMNPFNQVYVYEIQFNDGEVKTQVSATEMRQTKNSRSRASSRNTSPRSALLSRESQSFGGSTAVNTQVNNNVFLSTDSTEPNPNHTNQQTNTNATSLVPPPVDGGVVTPTRKFSSPPQLTPIIPLSHSLSNSSLSQTHSQTSLDHEKTLPPINSQHHPSPHHSPSPHLPPVMNPKLPSFKVDLRKSESLGSISLDDRIDMSYDDEDDEIVFAIPRVYSRPGSSHDYLQHIEDYQQSVTRSGIMVPRMQLDNLDLTSSLDHGASSGSLSGSILRDAPKKIFNTNDSSNDYNGGGGTSDMNLSPRGAIDRLLVDYSRDDTSTLTRIESWRDTAGWTTRRSSGVGLPRSSRNTTNTSHASTNSLFSGLHPNSSNGGGGGGGGGYQSNAEALKMIHIAVADISLELHIMIDLIKTYETILSILFYYTVTELSETQTLFPSIHRYSFASLYSKSEGGGGCGGGSGGVGGGGPGSRSPCRTNSGASASKMESHLSQEISHDFDEFETFPQPEKKEYGNAKQILFSIREFLNSDLPGVCHGHLMTSLSYIGPNAIRLLKLSSLLLFENILCLPNHLKSSSAEKISSGSFGSVYRICCPDTCTHAVIPNINQYYAIKRITRERSIHDTSVIFEIYTEITALETMSSYVGVCDLINYGLYEGEYWMILEQGICDLKDWITRQYSQSMKKYSLPHLSNGTGGISTKMTPGSGGVGDGVGGGVGVGTGTGGIIDQLLLHCYIYRECLSIVKAVHDSEIIHFDVKCNNFILRKIPVLEEMIEAASHHKLSGAIFLADFGESIIRSDCDYNTKIKQRSRGTLPILSPEMLCLNNDTQKYKNVRASKFPPSTLSDVWSLGCLFFEILVSTFLFENKSWTELFCMLCMEKFQPPEVSKLLAELLPYPDILLPSTSRSSRTEFDDTSGRPGTNISTSVGEIILAILQQNPRDRPQIVHTLGELHKLTMSLLPYRTTVSRRLTDLTPPINYVITHYPNQLRGGAAAGAVGAGEATPSDATPSSGADVTKCAEMSLQQGEASPQVQEQESRVGGGEQGGFTTSPPPPSNPPFDLDEDRQFTDFSRHSVIHTERQSQYSAVNTTRSETPSHHHPSSHPDDVNTTTTTSVPNQFLTSRSNAGGAKHCHIDLVPAPAGSWLVNSQVSFNIGYVFQQCVESELTNSGKHLDNSVNHRTIPVYAPIRSNILDSAWRQLLPTSLDEYVTTISSIMSQGSAFTSTLHSSTSINRYNIERSIIRSLHNHCPSSTPALSYFNLSSNFTCDSQIHTAHIINTYAITLHSNSQLPTYVSDTSSVSLIRISSISSKLLLDTPESYQQFLKKIKFTNGVFCHTFISNTQHLCLIPESTYTASGTAGGDGEHGVDGEYEIAQIVLATLKYALTEISQGRSIAICLDPYPVLNTSSTDTLPPSLTSSNGISGGGVTTAASSSSSTTGLSPAAVAMTNSTLLNINKIYYSKLCVTIGIFLSCAADAAEEFTEEAVHDSYRASAAATAAAIDAAVAGGAGPMSGGFGGTSRSGMSGIHHTPLQNLTGSTRGEKLGMILERKFFWMMPSMDMNFFRVLCALADSVESLDHHHFTSHQLFQMEYTS